MTCLLASFDNKWKKSIRIMLQTNYLIYLSTEEFECARELTKNLWLIIDNPKNRSKRTNEGYELDNAMVLCVI
jgi:hypothetical protein